jgi:ferredoxin
MNFRPPQERGIVGLEGNKRNNMAEISNRLPGNIEGPYYVDNTCIDCDLCRTTAPEFFRREAESGYSVVFRQPLTPEEVETVELALQDCPTESIGRDGSKASRN